MNNEEIELALWEYMDGTCAAGAREQIAHKIANEPKWEQTYQRILATHMALQAAETDQPSLRFNKNVMEAIAALPAAAPAKIYINRSIIRGIAAFFLVTISIAFIGALSATQWGTAPIHFNNIIKLPTFSVAGLLPPGIADGGFIPLVVAINIVLLLVLIDMSVRRRPDNAPGK